MIRFLSSSTLDKMRFKKMKLMIKQCKYEQAWEQCWRKAFKG